MAAGKLKLLIEQGATFRKRLLWSAGDPALPVDLTGWTARMQLRSAVNSPTVIHELTTANGGIALGGVAGTIDLYISEAITAALLADGVYDLELVAPGGDVTRLLKGMFKVSLEVTRDV